MFHTGLKAAFDISPNFWLTALVANGWNNSLDNNAGKSFGLQASARINRGSEDAPLFDVHLGYLFGPEQQDYGSVDYCRDVGGTFDPFLLDCVDDLPTSSSIVQRDAGGANGFEAFRHLIDLVASLNPSDQFSVLFNADLGFEGTRVGSVNDQGFLDGFESQSWWAVGLAGRYVFSPIWAGALRAEVLGDKDGRLTFGDPHVNAVKDLLLYSATATVEAAPSSHLIVRLDARLMARTKTFSRTCSVVTKRSSLRSRWASLQKPTESNATIKPRLAKRWSRAQTSNAMMHARMRCSTSSISSPTTRLSNARIPARGTMICAWRR